MQFRGIDVFGKLRRFGDLLGLLLAGRRVPGFPIRPLFPARPVGAGPLPPVLSTVAPFSGTVVLAGTPVLIPSAFPAPITVAGRLPPVLTRSAVVAFCSGAMLAAPPVIVRPPVIMRATGALVAAAAVLVRTSSAVFEPGFAFTVASRVALPAATVLAVETTSTAVVLPVVTTRSARTLPVIAAGFSPVLTLATPPVGRTAAPIVNFSVAAESAAVTARAPSTVAAFLLLPVVGFAPRLLTAALSELALPVPLRATIVAAGLPAELVATGAVLPTLVLAWAAAPTILLRPAVTASGRPLLAGGTTATGIGSAAATAARVIGPGHQTSWELPNSLDNQRRPHPHPTGRHP